MVLQYVEPWVSDKDIAAGERWAQSIASELEASNFGIICITPENMNSEWIFFEAGALSKSMLDGKVVPLLFGLELSDLSGPLAQFQSKKIDEQGVFEVVKSINSVAERPATPSIVDQLVPSLWPSLAEKLSKVPQQNSDGKHKRSQSEILEELVAGIRGINSRIRETENDYPDKDLRYRKRNYRTTTRIFNEIIASTENEGGELLSLVAVSGVLKDEFPWISELIMELYRSIRDNKIEHAKYIKVSLERFLKLILFNPQYREFVRDERDTLSILDLTGDLINRVLNDAVNGRFRGRLLKEEQGL